MSASYSREVNDQFPSSKSVRAEMGTNMVFVNTLFVVLYFSNANRFNVFKALRILVGLKYS